MNLADLKLSPDVHAQLSGVVQMVKTAVSTASAAPLLFTGVGAPVAAASLAQEAGQPLYRVDLSAVVSQSIGETEKNLDRAFAAAQAQGAILFFDEADALFGKRTEVQDAHDKYANIEVSYLLERMAQYSSVVIVATQGEPDLANCKVFRDVVRLPHRPWP
ncbi:ATP-binding protein [Edaphobacter flagellatus]|uniref:ATP-binding protein n=1 Tax=Edaphobacter flagellatus TaxID=1933044 RepID=UPI0021B23F79|nr:ATP-binding protein [Edaphobacter flagellatus]